MASNKKVAAAPVVPVRAGYGESLAATSAMLSELSSLESSLGGIGFAGVARLGASTTSTSTWFTGSGAGSAATSAGGGGAAGGAVAMAPAAAKRKAPGSTLLNFNSLAFAGAAPAAPAAATSAAAAAAAHAAPAVPALSPLHRLQAVPTAPARAPAVNPSSGGSRTRIKGVDPYLLSAIETFEANTATRLHGGRYTIKLNKVAKKKAGGGGGGSSRRGNRRKKKASARGSAYADKQDARVMRRTANRGGRHQIY